MCKYKIDNIISKKLYIKIYARNGQQFVVSKKCFAASSRAYVDNITQAFLLQDKNICLRAVSSHQNTVPQPCMYICEYAVSDALK